MALDGVTPYPAELARAYVEKGFWEQRTLGDLLDAAAARSPAAEAVVDHRQRLTYAGLRDAANRLALQLAELGIGRGDRVLVQLPNWAEFEILYFALAKMGAISVMALPPHRQRELIYMGRLSEAVALVMPDHFRRFDYAPLAAEIRRQVPSLAHLIMVGDEVPAGWVDVRRMLTHASRGGSNAASCLAALRPDPMDVAVLLTTGGTTADPKLVPRTHNDYICNARDWGATWRRDHTTSYLAITPIAHNAALLGGLMISVYQGAKLVLLDHFTAEATFELIERERISTSIFVPTQVVAMLESPALGSTDFSSFRHVCCGAAHVAEELVRGLKEKMGAVTLNTFGMAEGPISTTRPEDPFEVSATTVGRPDSPEAELRIVDDDGNPVAPGAEGELLWRCPHTIRGYYRVPEVNRTAFTPDGFLCTGDMARFTPEGYLQITGRKKDVIIRGGENISAVEVEELLLTHEAVEDVAVVGMPDARFGERVCAYVIPRGAARPSLSELGTFLIGKGIAKFKLPERLEYVENFPLTNIGKVDKNALRRDIQTRLAAAGAKSGS
ncbi:MAG: AMP-binding protein [Candidatus Tectomicrobia bacterium]|nr:AMP-binding protein [Candidatus Tectomicrobia bacterium]